MERKERQIKDLSPGQSAWTVPWGLHEAQGKQWLHPRYTAHSVPGGTVQMRVTALAPKGSQTARYFVHTGRHGIIVGLAPFGGPKKEATMTPDEGAETFSGTYHFRKRDKSQESDGVKNETWIEYHDRLIREYYDFDTEWALITEICPEVEKVEATPKRKRTKSNVPPMARKICLGTSCAYLAVSASFFMLGEYVVAALWFTLAMPFLALAIGSIGPR